MDQDEEQQSQQNASTTTDEAGSCDTPQSAGEAQASGAGTASSEAASAAYSHYAEEPNQSNAPNQCSPEDAPSAPAPAEGGETRDPSEYDPEPIDPNAPADEHESHAAGVAHAVTEGVEVWTDVKKMHVASGAAMGAGAAIAGYEAVQSAREGNAGGTMCNALNMVPLMAVGTALMMPCSDKPMVNGDTGMTDRQEAAAGYRTPAPPPAGYSYPYPPVSGQ